MNGIALLFVGSNAVYMAAKFILLFLSLVLLSSCYFYNFISVRLNLRGSVNLLLVVIYAIKFKVNLKYFRPAKC